MHKRRSVHQFTTEAGLKVKVYRIRPEDAENLVNLFEHLSDTSRYQRFNETLSNSDPQFIWQTAQRMATVEPKQGAAWVAFAGRTECTGGRRALHVSAQWPIG